jgi:hypothetical protein
MCRKGSKQGIIPQMLLANNRGVWLFAAWVGLERREFVEIDRLGSPLYHGPLQSP